MEHRGEVAELRAGLHRSATRDGIYWHVVLALVFLRRERPTAWRDLTVWLNKSSQPADRLADTFADAGLFESAGAVRRLADGQPATWHAVRRAIYIIDGVGVESDLTDIFDRALDQLGDGMSGQFFTPRSVARLIAELVGPITARSRCLDPFSRAGELLVEVAVAGGDSPPLVVQASHPESTLVELAEMNLAMHGVRATVSKSELGSLAMEARVRFDIVVSNPPFGFLSDAEVDDGLRRRYGSSRRQEFNWLQLVIESLDENGRGAVIMPNGAASTLAPREREIRRGLVESGALAAVVALPTQLFGGTSIGVALWLVRSPSRRRGEVLFIDAQTLGGMSTRTRRQLAPHDIEDVSQEYRRWLSASRADRKFVPRVGFSATATAAAIADQNYSLFPPSYVQPEAVATDHDSDADFSALTSELIRLTNVARGIDADVNEMLRGSGER
ncbi:class I SAM-dependent DNA methyltransferase [Micromonospora sp. NPDC048898]|uniref:HsdM family class I SAM-dependent methyltransferase n=1 Tax=Micromonospora sp. NPDC048898 TaxID=3364260 RepID=UPI003710B397